MPKEHRKRKISEETEDSLNFESLSVSMESEKEKKSKKRRKDKKSQKQVSDSIDSESDSLADSDSEGSQSRSRSREKNKKSKKSTKSKKSKKEKKDKKDKKQKNKKTKKTKTKKEKKKNQFGKYGIISAQDFYDKKEEFLAWMAEIKGLNIESVNQFEEKRLFEEYVEDYNLANFPNKKYYDLQLYQKKLQQKAFIQQQQKELENIEMVVFNDEDQLKQKNKKQAEDFKKQQEQLQLQQLLQNQNIAKDIKEQQNIQNQLIQSYKTGDQQKVLELKKKLEPKKDENQGYQNQDDYI